MDDTVILMRMIERLVGVIIGGISIYLGYRLFLDIPYQRNQEKGEIELPGMKLVLSKVGPGIFFAAFGSLVLYQSMSQNITLTTNATSEPTNQTSQSENTHHFVGAIKNDAEQDSRLRLRAITSIEKLNCVKRLLTQNSTDKLQPEIYLAIEHAKRELLVSAWDKDWGNTDQLTLYGIRDSASTQVKDLFNSEHCE